uniref:NADH-plastoquinone oxidoreductase subunit 4L n=1 Tax=Abies georgei var. smithii TaxID=2358304 RepID=A0A858YDB1_9CONI|nr:NADH-plastoquinone oxidoreductase subunit 4L [Abies georgei var. smithii]QJU48727.1 NADH-plastoquinone oxidoreductase subunit 4L [Abies georgei var. smithii]
MKTRSSIHLFEFEVLSSLSIGIYLVTIQNRALMCCQYCMRSIQIQ